MQYAGSILSLYISKKETSQSVEQSCITVDTDGIIQDKHYKKNTQRSILITSTASYELLASHDITVPYGTLGENLLIDFNPYSLPVGTRLQIANTLLEITQNCTLCKHLAIHDKRIPKLLKNDRGIFAKVIHSGKISVGDTISLIEM